jgi:hypothetical protein
VHVYQPAGSGSKLPALPTGSSLTSKVSVRKAMMIIP